MELLDKLTILADAAKYDAACTSSGARRGHKEGMIGCTSSSLAGCCHTFSADGRCVTLLKVLLSNDCCYDCKYCVNRRTNDTPRASFEPRELAELTIGFYRRNYIEGLFLSSAVLGSPDRTTERMIETLRLLRGEYRFNGYIHAKAIPGASPELVTQLGLLADRLSVNIELPSETSLRSLAPNKTKAAILAPMRQIRDQVVESKAELVKYRSAPRFAPAGQATQLIVGATGESDRHILNLTESLYERYRLRRVFYSAYVPVVENTLLPSLDTKPPLLREHRLYQADWLLRFYGFRASELLDEAQPDFDPRLDPKCCWALRHPEFFPVEVNRADYETLLRIPGMGVVSAKRILVARRTGPLHADDLRKLGVVMKRAQYFITCAGRLATPLRLSRGGVLANLLAVERAALPPEQVEQLSLFDPAVGTVSIMWQEIIYQYDGSFAGLLCCIYESYTQKERPTAILCDGDAEPSLFEIRMVPSVPEHAARVERSLRKLSADVVPFLRRVFLTCLPEKELAIYRFVVKLYRESAPYLSRLSDEAYQPLLRAVRHMSAEVEHLRGFVRFSIHDGILSAEIEPKNRVLPLLRGHFCERCHNETFFIYDRTHREALFYSGSRSRIVPLESFESAPPDTEEAAYRRLWKRFYDTIAIRERENPRLRMTHMPKRYWAAMTEFQSENDASNDAPPLPPTDASLG